MSRTLIADSVKGECSSTGVFDTSLHMHVDIYTIYIRTTELCILLAFTARGRGTLVFPRRDEHTHDSVRLTNVKCMTSFANRPFSIFEIIRVSLSQPPEKRKKNEQRSSHPFILFTFLAKSFSSCRRRRGLLLEFLGIFIARRRETFWFRREREKEKQKKKEPKKQK